MEFDYDYACIHADKLKEIMMREFVPVKQIARWAEISELYVNRMLRGDSKYVPYPIVVSIADCMGVNPDEFADIIKQKTVDLLPPIPSTPRLMKNKVYAIEGKDYLFVETAPGKGVTHYRFRSLIGHWETSYTNIDIWLEWRKSKPKSFIKRR